jgi:hypothetical protein
VVQGLQVIEDTKEVSREVIGWYYRGYQYFCFGVRYSIFIVVTRLNWYLGFSAVTVLLGNIWFGRETMAN